MERIAHHAVGGHPGVLLLEVEFFGLVMLRKINCSSDPMTSAAESWGRAKQEPA
jgi:hypothetical protein